MKRERKRGEEERRERNRRWMSKYEVIRRILVYSFVWMVRLGCPYLNT
jgi:hypothetical protein